MKDHSFTGVEVGRGNPQRDTEILKRSAFQDTREKRDHAVVRGESVAGKGPPGKTGESGVARYLIHFGERQAAAVAGADQCTHAGASDEADRNAFLLENFQNADMGNAAGEASPECDTYGRNTNGGNGGNRLAGKLAPKCLHRANDLPQTFHVEPHILWPVEAQNLSANRMPHAVTLAASN